MNCHFRPRIRILHNWAEMTDRAKSPVASMEDAAIRQIASRLAVADTLSETAAAKQAGQAMPPTGSARRILPITIRAVTRNQNVCGCPELNGGADLVL